MADDIFAAAEHRGVRFSAATSATRVALRTHSA